MIAGARKRGVDVTTELYPSEAASTGIQAAIFDPGWQERLGGSYRQAASMRALELERSAPKQCHGHLRE